MRSEAELALLLPHQEAATGKGPRDPAAPWRRWKYPLVSGSASATTANTSAPDSRSTGARGVPANPADLMLRIVNHMVDSFLAMRRELSHQLDHWQTELLSPKTRFANWSTLLDARLTLHQLDELCDDQRTAIQDWLEALKSWTEEETHLSQHERDLLQVRSRDVLEHIDRVVHLSLIHI